MKKILVVLLFAALFLTPVVSAEDATKSAPGTADPFLKIKEAKDCKDAFDACKEVIGQCKTYDDYERTALGLKDLIARRKDYQCPPSLYYAVGKTRTDELGCLAKQNDIESGRVYMSVSEKYYREALEYLDKCEQDSKTKDLTLESYLLKFLIFKELFQQEKADAIFNDIVNKIASYTPDKAQNLAKLNELSKKFSDNGIDDYAMKLKFVYASKVDPQSANMLADDIRANADKYLDEGNTKEALSTYDTYIQLADTCFDKDTVAAKIMDIAEKYFEKRRYRDAAKYYSLYLARYGSSQVADYADYKLALSFYSDRDYANAVNKFTEFLKTYQNSVWFEKGFETLCKLYYETSETDGAIASLQKLIDEYPRRDTRDYAYLLTAVLYYGKPDYDKALGLLKNMQKEFPKSAYYNAAQALITDINDIKKGAAPSYSFGSKDVYRVWDSYTSANGSVGAAGAERIDKEGAKPGELFIKAQPGTQITFTATDIQDLDRFNEYQQDKEDPSRLPRELKNGTEKDLLFMTWSAPDSGKFLDDKQSPSRVWQAPDAPGEYIITINTGDMALVRPPDSGNRKDRINPLVIHVIVEK